MPNAGGGLIENPKSKAFQDRLDTFRRRQSFSEFRVRLAIKQPKTKSVVELFDVAIVDYSGRGKKK